MTKVSKERKKLFEEFYDLLLKVSLINILLLVVIFLFLGSDWAVMLGGTILVIYMLFFIKYLEPREESKYFLGWLVWFVLGLLSIILGWTHFLTWVLGTYIYVEFIEKKRGKNE
jgi:hypothetical protein